LAEGDNGLGHGTFALGFLLLILTLTTVAPINATGVDIDTRITKGFDWILCQETEYFPGSRAFVSAVTSEPDRYRIYVDENAIAASALVMYHKVFSSKKYDDKLKSALRFIMAAQTSEKDFHHYWNMTTHKWNEEGKFYFWNAYALEGLAFAAFHMRLSSTLESEKSFYDQARKTAVACIEKWHDESQQPDGRWALSYPDTENHAEIDENGMILTALLYLALYELNWGDHDKMRTYTDWAQKTVIWILSRQEKSKSSWGYGGFYHDEIDNMQYTDSNGRAMFGLTSYLRTISSLTNQIEPTFSNVRASIYVWSDNFLLKMIDNDWGAYWYRTSLDVTKYPKQVYRAAELMRALVEIWIVLGDMKFVDYASNLYHWMTGTNEEGIDLQQALNRKSTNGGFYIGINANGSVENDSNVETTATATGAFIYGRWITIPEFSRNRSALLVIPSLSVILCVAYSRKLRRRAKQASNLEDSPCRADFIFIDHS
jgi:hypothetical protein